MEREDQYYERKQQAAEFFQILNYCGYERVCKGICEKYSRELEQSSESRGEIRLDAINRKFVLDNLGDVVWEIIHEDIKEHHRSPFPQYSYEDVLMRSLAAIEDPEEWLGEEARIYFFLQYLNKWVAKNGTKIIPPAESKAAEPKKPESPAIQDPGKKETDEKSDFGNFSCTKTCCCGCLTMWLLGVLTAAAIWLLPQLGLDGPVFEWFVNLADQATTIICVILGILGVIGFWYYFFGDDKRP